jgi:hypothetical protein
VTYATFTINIITRLWCCTADGRRCNGFGRLRRCISQNVARLGKVYWSALGKTIILFAIIVWSVYSWRWCSKAVHYYNIIIIIIITIIIIIIIIITGRARNTCLWINYYCAKSMRRTRRRSIGIANSGYTQLILYATQYHHEYRYNITLVYIILIIIIMIIINHDKWGKNARPLQPPHYRGVWIYISCAILPSRCKNLLDALCIVLYILYDIMHYVHCQPSLTTRKCRTAAIHVYLRQGSSTN